MQHLTDELLLESYHQALELKLSDEFIQLLLIEIRRRELHTVFNLFKAQKRIDL